MSRAAVVMFRCDGCQKTGEPGPIPERWKSSVYMSKKERLPDGWVEVVGKSNDRDIFGAHYCVECAKELERLMSGMAVNEAILRGEGVKPQFEEFDADLSRILKQLAEIKFASQSDGNRVLVHMQEIESKYGLITVADFYDLVNVDPEVRHFADEKYGWRRSELDETFVVGLLDSTDHGLTLPTPVLLDAQEKADG